jgi:hypothetical protein
LGKHVAIPVPERLSTQAMIAPPAPSETMTGSACPPITEHTVAPLAGQAASIAPETRMCWA